MKMTIGINDKNVDYDCMTLATLTEVINGFFESGEGKDVRDVQQLLMRLGWKNYFDLLRVISFDGYKEQRVFGIPFTIDGSLGPRDIVLEVDIPVKWGKVVDRFLMEKSDV